MPDKNNKTPNNVPGKYYVDNNCISCSQCGDIAPDYFAQLPSGEYHVTKQPTTPEEVTLCEQALAACPVNAIGNDGE